MSGKYMKVKKIFIPMLTAMVICSQLAGCAVASQSEMLQMINNQQAICIEVAVPDFEEQGTEIEYEWTELASLDNYPEFRMNFEDSLSVVALGQGGKNGTMYVDLEGNHTNNSTFYYAMMNKKFREQINNTDINEELVASAKANYVDVESDAEAKLAYINAYFNIFADNEPSYYNGSSTVTRAEFLGAVYRSNHPVSDLTASMDFQAKVDPNGTCNDTVFAEQMLDKSYLNLEDKSLNTKTFTGAITRAEAIYTLVQEFYADEYAAVTGKEAAFSDTKNGGDIASKQKFIETTKDKETKEEITTYKDYWKSYELQYAIDNADKGMPDDLYKAMVVAKQVGLVNANESRWDEAITKNEALNFLFRIYSNMDTITNADRGIAVGEAVDNSTGDGKFDNPYADYTTTDESLADYEVTITEELNTQLYVVKAADILKLDQEGAGGISPVEVGAYLTVTGKTSNNWYQVQWGSSVGYLPADVLSTEDPHAAPDPSEVIADNGMTAEEVLDKFNEAMGGLDESVVGPDGSGMENLGVMPDYDKTEAW